MLGNGGLAGSNRLNEVRHRPLAQSKLRNNLAADGFSENGKQLIWAHDLTLAIYVSSSIRTIAPHRRLEHVIAVVTRTVAATAPLRLSAT